MRHGSPESEVRGARLGPCLAVVLAVSLGLLSVFAFVPGSRPALVDEDRLLEQATALVFFGGFVAGTLRALGSRAVPGTWLLVPLVSLVGCLDEIGFGVRRFPFPLPRLRGIEIDGLHDLFLVAYDVLETRNRPYLAAYAAGAVCCVAALALGLRSRRWRSLPSRLGPLLPWPFVSLAIGLLLPALVLDLDLVENVWLVFVEELLELDVAIVLLFAGLAAPRGRPARREP